MPHYIIGGNVEEVLEDGEPWTAPNGTRYPRNDGQLRQYPGRQEVVETERPTGVLVAGSSVAMIGGVPTRVWTTEPLPPPTLAEINAPILRQIQVLEATVSARRMREAVIVGPSWLASVDAQIAALRGQLET
ncbi:hypothetical protein UFOVP1299_38 [uncultured Caudovirales phage]|uniref:Uncharacterized protein n=1 Tax=uncultured Caudovirales phage TaxID=2100421 RepID=A0A6J5RNS9_9CAUD|nr:hypothetical protein UFOVP1299_38 [uncultured Caudovirales phage]